MNEKKVGSRKSAKHKIPVQKIGETEQSLKKKEPWGQATPIGERGGAGHQKGQSSLRKNKRLLYGTSRDKIGTQWGGNTCEKKRQE